MMFFGHKKVNPSMKDAKMETDCGGMIITRGNMTYGEADTLAVSIDIPAVHRYIRNGSHFPLCYWKRKPDGTYYIGDMWWAIYSYLAHNKIIKGEWNSYDNTLEYLYDVILKRLEEANFVSSDDTCYFKIG